MKKILIIAFSNLNQDARVNRQIEFIKTNYALSVVCYAGRPNHGYEIISIPSTCFSIWHKLFASFYLITHQFQKAYSLLYQVNSVIKKLSFNTYDLIIANDVESLPLAFSLKDKAKILFDAHEYAPRHFEDKLVWRIFFQPFNIHLCKKYIPLIDSMITVSKGLAKEYHKEFGLLPHLINNATWYTDTTPSVNRTDKIRLIHHGGATPSRKLELMIDLMQFLDDRFTLDLVLVVPPRASSKTVKYINDLKTLAQNNKRISFLNPISSDDLVKFLNQYDIGIFLLPPINFNYANTLPNKLFDFIQARLAIAIGPTPEMAEIVHHYDIGIVADTFTPKNLAAKLNSLTAEDIVRYKNNTAKAAQKLNAETNQEHFLKILDSIGC